MAASSSAANASEASKAATWSSKGCSVASASSIDDPFL